MSEIPTFLISISEKAKAHDILNAIRTLQQIETEQRPATPEERDSLFSIPGFGCWGCFDCSPILLLANTRTDPRKVLGEELQSILTPEEYDSAKRTTFTAFYTSPIVMQAMHEAMSRLGLPKMLPCWSPGRGAGGFLVGAGGPAFHRRGRWIAFPAASRQGHLPAALTSGSYKFQRLENSACGCCYRQRAVRSGGHTLPGSENTPCMISSS